MPEQAGRPRRGMLKRAAMTVWRRVYLPPVVRHEITVAYVAGREYLAFRRDQRTPLALAWRPRVRVLVPVRDHPLAAVRATVASVRRQTYQQWELFVVPEAPSTLTEGAGPVLAAGDARVKVWRALPAVDSTAAVAAALTAPGADYVAIVEPGDTLTGNALSRVVELLNAAPDTAVVYTDEEVVGSLRHGRRAVKIYKPDWSPEHALSEPYTGRLSVYRRALVADVGAIRDGFGAAREYDLLLRLHERGARIEHLPRVLYRRGAAGSTARPDAWRAEVARAVAEHLERVGADAVYVEPSADAPARVRHSVRGTPRVSIIIPTIGTMTRDVGGRTIDLLAHTVRSITERTEYPQYEIVYVYDRPLRPETLAVLKACGAPLRPVPYDRPFNWSDKMNVGAAAATGDHLLALNDDMEVINGDWLSAMLEFSQQPEVGAVGAKLYFPDGSIQHAGVVVSGGSPGHPYHGLPRERQAGVTDLMFVRNYSAVTGACLMTRAEVFRQVGGFAPTFPVNYNDVDYCLRIRALGYRVVFTPHAQLYHYESVSRAHAANSNVRPEELEQLARVWPDIVARDPYHDVRRRSVWAR